MTMTEEQYLDLARQKYQELQELKSKPTFYDYEKRFVEIWQDLGGQVLESSLSDVAKDRRKKKDDYPLWSNRNSESFSHHPNGFGVSPYLQEQ
jgi:hypothetical protein